MMLWSAEFSEPLSEQEEANRLEVKKDRCNLPLKDAALMAELPEFIRKLYTFADGMEVLWEANDDSSRGGRIHFIEARHVMRDGLGQTYNEEDLVEEELLKYFKPFDLVTDESECGFLLNPGFASNAIYYHVTGRPQLYNLDLDFDGYLEMATASSAYYHWPKVLIDIQNGDESQETLDFKKNMPLIFDNFDWDEFVAKYQELRLSANS